MSQEKFGRFLEVDLSKYSFSEKIYGENLIKKFLGGPGFAIDYLMREKVYQIKPLGLLAKDIVRGISQGQRQEGLWGTCGTPFASNNKGKGIRFSRRLLSRP